MCTHMDVDVVYMYRVSVHVFVCVYVCVCVCFYMCICTYACMHVCEHSMYVSAREAFYMEPKFK